METLPSPLRIALLVTGVFERLGVPYLVGGSVASSIQGEPRSTDDIDIVAGLRIDHVVPFVGAVEQEFLVEQETVRRAIERHASFNLIHMDTVQKVDVFVPSDEPYAGEQMSRRRKITLEPVSTASFFVSAPEDTVLAKLLWFRKGGRVSDRQWRDILGVLKVQSTHLDRTYLDLWAARLTVGDLLKEALVDAGLSL